MSEWNKDDAGQATGGGDFWKASEHVGELTMFLRVTPDTAPAFSDPSKTVSIANAGNVVVLDGGSKGDIYDESAIWGNLGKSLAGGAPAKFIVGRVTEGAKKPGQNAPFILDDSSDAEMAIAIEFLEEHATKDKDGNPVLKADTASF